MTEKVSKEARRRLLVVNTGSRKKRFTLRRLHELGYELLVLNATVNWARNYVDTWLLADTSDHDAALRAVRKHLKSNPDRPIHYTTAP